MKPTQAAIDAFARIVPEDPRSEQKKMFGHPAAFTGGHMYAGTFEGMLVFRLGGEDASDPLAAGALPFEPMEGRPWKDYVALPAVLVDDARARGWARTALDRAAALPAKAPKAPKAPKALKAPKGARAAKRPATEAP